MSKQCAICQKKTVTGRSISHAHNVTSRPFRPNLQRVRAVVERERHAPRPLQAEHITSDPLDEEGMRRRVGAAAAVGDLLHRRAVDEPGRADHPLRVGGIDRE